MSYDISLILLSAAIGTATALFLLRGPRVKIFRRHMRRTAGIVPWLVSLLISVAMSVVSYVLMPKPKTSSGDTTKEMDDPVAEAGKPISMVFGTMTKKELNVLGFWDKSFRKYKVDA